MNLQLFSGLSFLTPLKPKNLLPEASKTSLRQLLKKWVIILGN